MLASGRLLQQRYRIIRPLSKGGMGAVYEARDERLSYTVALKETLFSDEELRKAFEREARILARLRHPSLPKVSDHFSEGKGQFLVMEFITGKDLLELLDENGAALPLEDALFLAEQLVDVLEFLHQQNPPVIHRDIKPANIKLTERGEAILLDFGLAKGLGTLGGQTMMDASVRAWTPGYAPLEQLYGSGTNAQSDLFSLGATLYHIMTGKQPPDVITRSKILFDTKLDPLYLANQINPRIPFEISQVLAKTLALDRDQRPASAGAMRELLAAASATYLAGNSRKRQLSTGLSLLVATPRRTRGPEIHQQATEDDISDAETDVPANLVSHNSTTVPSVSPDEPATKPYPASKRPKLDTISTAETVPIGSSKPKPVPAAVAMPQPRPLGTFLGIAVLCLAVLAGGGWLMFQWFNRNAPAEPAGTKTPAGKVMLDPKNNVKNSLGMELVLIPAGRFTMGSTRVESEEPIHPVNIPKPFYLAKCEVTQEQWYKVMGTSPSYFKGNALPVESVSWDDAQAFLKKLNARKDGFLYRLPSEAEWEYACRAQSTEETPADLEALAWHSKNAKKQTHPVGGKQPNPFGLQDMLGNVAEWCQDAYHKTYQGAPADDQSWEINPDSPYRMVRGGSWYGLENFCRPAFRDWMAPESRGIYVGFRVAAVKNEATSKETSGSVGRSKIQSDGRVR